MRYRLGFVVAVVAAAGCGPKLDISKTFKLPEEDGVVAYRLVPDPQSRDQKITVKVEVTGDPVDVFVLKAADVPAPIITSEKEKKEFEGKAFGFVRGTKSGTFTCTVPAKTNYEVVIILSGSTGTKTEGTVKLTN
jgi:hypothetical protein